MPSKHLCDPKFQYTPSYATDIRATLKKHGMKPVNRSRQEKMKRMLNGVRT